MAQMHRVWNFVWGLLIWLGMGCGGSFACVVAGFDGAQPLPSWDARDALARRIEADGAALGLPAGQVTRLAWALRLGLPAAPALTAADLAALRAFDVACADPVADSGVEPSYGFDLKQGWQQLVASGAFSALALSGIVIAARLHAIRRRRKKRYFCSLAVQCRDGPDGVQMCRVEDISLSGARLSLRGAGPFALGSVVDLDFGSVQMRGRVAWANRHFTGVDFERLLTRAELLHLVRPEKYPAPLRGPVGTGPPVA
jgi:hypothetical protein